VNVFIDKYLSTLFINRMLCICQYESIGTQVGENSKKSVMVIKSLLDGFRPEIYMGKNK